MTQARRSLGRNRTSPFWRALPHGRGAAVGGASDATPMATAPTGLVGWNDSGGGIFTPGSCTLGGATTDPMTGAVSTSCAVSFTPNVVGAHTIAASYGGDTTHTTSIGTTIVTAITRSTTTGVICSPTSV